MEVECCLRGICAGAIRVKNEVIERPLNGGLGDSDISCGWRWGGRLEVGGWRLEVEVGGGGWAGGRGEVGRGWR